MLTKGSLTDVMLVVFTAKLSELVPYLNIVNSCFGK